MASLWGKLSMATSAAITTFLRVYTDPEGEQTRQQFERRQGAYRMRWQYYLNSAFEDLAKWTAYKSRYRLYRHTRSIYNPARRLVDFYAGIIYPGMLTDDASRLPDGTPIAIPFPTDTDPAIRTAIAQLWQWSNWQINKSLMVRYGAALGDVFVHVVDDVDGGKVWPEVLWPGLIADLDLDERGNVQSYALEYDYEADGQTYTYRREVDRDAIRTFRNGEPFAYDDVPPVLENPYGFVPAVWVKHVDLGGDHGESAMRNLGKWDELNSLAAHALDQAHKVLAAPLLVAGEGVRKLADPQAKRAATAELTQPELDREAINLLTASPGSRIEAAQLPEGEALAHIERLLTEIEADHPEIVMFNRLREMSQVTGPGAARLFGDVEIYVNDARANYDTQSIKLFQMALAIGGMRASSGDWGPSLTNQQEKFRPFSLDSYAAGELDFSIEPRPLITPTAQERINEERQRLALENDRRGLNEINQPQAIANRLRAVTA